MSHCDHADVERLRSLTRQLLACAAAADWDSATAIEADRRPLLYRVFGGVSHGGHTRYRALLQEILVADQEIIHLAKQRHGELTGLLRQLGQGRSACRVYESNTASR